MQKLIDGVHKFQQEDFPQLRDLHKQFAHGQKPETLFITCSDSRIDPNLLTKSLPGDLFILRNAGNIVPPHSTVANGEAATIEFAVAGLQVKDIIVCGHSRCGAMAALLNPEKMADMPAMQGWLTHAAATNRIVKENYSNLSPDALLMATIQENVLVQIENLQTLPVVAARRARGAIHLHAWVYKIETGEVFAYDPRQNAFVPLSQLGPPTVDTIANRGVSI